MNNPHLLGLHIADATRMTGIRNATASAVGPWVAALVVAAVVALALGVA